jgi:hypothetical protein
MPIEEAGLSDVMFGKAPETGVAERKRERERETDAV